MKHVKLKILMSFTGILLGVVMLVSASYAWLTVSVTPEIQRMVIKVTPSGKEVPFEFSIDLDDDDVNFDADKATWTTELHLDQEIENYSLQPISTVDGEHWYLPTYSADGNVNGFREVPLDQCANRPNAIDNYLVYTDVYVRTRNTDENQQMVLSNPILNNVTDGEQHFASYVLWDPEWTEDGHWIDNDAMASVRIGFQYMTLDASGKETSTGDFFIYEPNADMRSSDFGEKLAQNDYTQMADQVYVFNDTAGAYAVKDYAGTFVENQYYPTYAPKYNSTTKKYDLVNVSTELGDRLVAQEKSSWDTRALVPGQKPTSKAIKDGTIGDLCIVENGQMKEVATTSRRELTTVTHETIQKMRIFIWIEGQDIDCWNQIIRGNIYANLEFMGRAVKKETNE